MGENYGTDAFSFRENGLGAVPSTLTEKKKKKKFYKVVIGCIIGEAQTMIEKGHFKARRPKAIQIIIIIATCLIALNTFLVPDLKWPQL